MEKQLYRETSIYCWRDEVVLRFLPLLLLLSLQLYIHIRQNNFGVLVTAPTPYINAYILVYTNMTNTNISVSESQKSISNIRGQIAPNQPPIFFVYVQQNEHNSNSLDHQSFCCNICILLVVYGNAVWLKILNCVIFLILYNFKFYNWLRRTLGRCVGQNLIPIIPCHRSLPKAGKCLYLKTLEKVHFIER